MEMLQQRAQVLVEALPYIREFYGKTIVVKYGGHAMVDDALKREVIRDLVLLHFVGITPILVHGGGPEITDMMKRMGKESEFVQGLRVTDAETAEIAQMVLVGKIQQELVQLVRAEGVAAVGLSGKDGDLLAVRRMGQRGPEGTDLGFVGEIQHVNPGILHTLIAGRYLPVVSCIGGDPKGNTLNLNGDHCAGKLAQALGCAKLIMMTDVQGILRDPKDPSTLIPELTVAQARELIANKVVDKGMIPKVEACLWALEGGVKKAHIINGAVLHCLLMELFTRQGIGTMIVGTGERRA
ncbi:MAG: acetylglutamate kinase [Deltaproteobacteria bacterium]|nr:acetylglutamate kinase [Deltaproteobacteria bacterium]